MTTNKQLIIYQVDHPEILNNDISRLKEFFKGLDRKYRKDACQSTVILIDGYNDVPEELYVIPEVIKWVKKLHNEVPHFMYYINRKMGTYYYLIIPMADEVVSMFKGEYKPISQYDLKDIADRKLPKVEVIVKTSRKNKAKMVKSILEHGRKSNNEQGAIEVVLGLGTFMGLDFNDAE